MRVYQNADQIANNGYVAATCPLDDFGSVEDPDFFDKYPALLGVLVLAAGLRPGEVFNARTRETRDPFEDF